MSQTALMPEPEQPAKKRRKPLKIVRTRQQGKTRVRVSARERDAYLAELFGPVGHEDN